jgi:hypothetical protein
MMQRWTKDIAAILQDGTAIDRAIERAGYDVVRRHRQLGVPLVIWRDGRVVEVPPESVPIPDDDDGAASTERA